MNYHPAAFERAADSTRGVSIHGWWSSCGAMLPMMDNFRLIQDCVYQSKLYREKRYNWFFEVCFLRVKVPSRLMKECKDEMDRYVWLCDSFSRTY